MSKAPCRAACLFSPNPHIAVKKTTPKGYIHFSSRTLQQQKKPSAFLTVTDQSLNSFCQWQSALVGKNGKHHDHAVLLMGFDIFSWKNELCDTLGFAPISSMCSKYRSWTINEDTGLGPPFTTAHESGHSFGMIHDGEGNPCRKAEGNIMSSTLTGNNGEFSWSVCSRLSLTGNSREEGRQAWSAREIFM